MMSLGLSLKMSREFEVILVDAINREHYMYRDRPTGNRYYSSLKINVFGNFSQSHLELIKNEIISFRGLLNKDFERVYIQYLTKIQDRRDALHIVNIKYDLPIINMYYFETDIISELEPFFYYSCLEDIMHGISPIVYFEKETDQNIFNTFLHPAVDDHEWASCHNAKTLLSQLGGTFNYEYYRIQKQIDEMNRINNINYE